MIEPMTNDSALPDVTWLKVSQVAAFMNVTRPTVHRWIKQGRLPATKLGKVVRIDERAVLALLTPPDEGWKP